MTAFPSPLKREPGWSHFIITLSDLICDSFFLWCHACRALTGSLRCLHTIFWWEISNMVRGTRVEQNCPIHYFDSLWSKRSNWSLTKDRLRNWLHFWTEIKDSLNLFFCLPGQTQLPLQTLASGQSLSSTSGPGHWLSSSSLETGRPESRSKQARKRLWIETILLPPITPAWESLCCREEEGTQGEQGVHSDHSLRMTKRR